MILCRMCRVRRPRLVHPDCFSTLPSPLLPGDSVLSLSKTKNGYNKPSRRELSRKERTRRRKEKNEDQTKCVRPLRGGSPTQEHGCNLSCLPASSGDFAPSLETRPVGPSREREPDRHKTARKQKQRKRLRARRLQGEHIWGAIESDADPGERPGQPSELILILFLLLKLTAPRAARTLPGPPPHRPPRPD